MLPRSAQAKRTETLRAFANVKQAEKRDGSKPPLFLP